MFFGYPGRAIPGQWQIHAAESTGEAISRNWFVWFVLFIWLNQVKKPDEPNQPNKLNKQDQTDQVPVMRASSVH